MLPVQGQSRGASTGSGRSPGAPAGVDDLAFRWLQDLRASDCVVPTTLSNAYDLLVDAVPDISRVGLGRRGQQPRPRFRSGAAGAIQPRTGDALLLHRSKRNTRQQRRRVLQCGDRVRVTRLTVVARSNSHRRQRGLRDRNRHRWHFH